MRDSEGASGIAPPQALIAARPEPFRPAPNNPNGIRTMAQADGAIALLGSNVFFSNRIDDLFAVVDTGAPGVPVFYENRPYGETNRNGQLLIPNLRAYGNNKISIDPKGLPVNAEIEQTDDVVTPADRSGVVVSFNAKTDTQSAVVIFIGANGKPIPVGTKGTIDGGDGAFVVGYDGRSFVKDLKSSNTAVLTTESGECRASFDYAPAGDRQIVIGPVTCQ